MKKKIIASFLFILIFICYILINSFEDSYKYPISPEGNSVEWQKRLENGEDMYALVDIPEKELRRMSTSKLLQAILDYPFISNLAYYNSFQTGFDAMYQSFSGLREFLSRSDAAEVLLVNYRSFDYSIPYSNFDHVWIEVLLSQDQILEKIEIKTLEDIVHNNIDKQIIGAAYGKLSGASFLLERIQHYKEK